MSTDYFDLVGGAGAKTIPLPEAPPAAVDLPHHDELARAVTSNDLTELRHDLSAQIRAMEARMADRLQFQGWALLAGVAVLLAIAAAVVELF